MPTIVLRLFLAVFVKDDADDVDDDDDDDDDEDDDVDGALLFLRAVWLRWWCDGGRAVQGPAPPGWG